MIRGIKRFLGTFVKRYPSTKFTLSAVEVLSAGLHDALTEFLPRITRISRNLKDNSSNSSNS